MFGAAGYFAMCGLALWGMAGGFGFGQLFGGASGGIALGFLIMGLVLFVIAGLLAFLGKTSISKAKPSGRDRSGQGHRRGRQARRHPRQCERPVPRVGAAELRSD